MKGRPLDQRIGFALAGLMAGWRRERSFRTHVASAVLALIVLLVLRPAPLWWAMVSIIVAMVLALELLNSAIEGVIDLLHPAIHPEIKAIKDMVAGAVLVVSLAALVVGAAMIVANFSVIEGWIGR